MSYNSRNKLIFYKKIQQIVQEHYEEGLTTYKGIFYKYVEPVYPMTYQTFMKIISEGNLETRIKSS
jgi:hypothetical protein